MKLCEIAGVKKSRTIPYHPMGNGMVEGYNKTLLNMLGTLSDNQKSDWKSGVSTMTHAYNTTEHESTGYAPFYLMFGRHPRLLFNGLPVPKELRPAKPPRKKIVKSMNPIKQMIQVHRQS